MMSYTAIHPSGIFDRCIKWIFWGIHSSESGPIFRSLYSSKAPGSTPTTSMLVVQNTCAGKLAWYFGGAGVDAEGGLWCTALTACVIMAMCDCILVAFGTSFWDRMGDVGRFSKINGLVSVSKLFALLFFAWGVWWPFRLTLPVWSV